MIIMFLDAMASLEFMLESERVGDVFGILSNLGHIFRVCSVFYGKHCQRHNRLKYRVVLLKKLLKVVPQALNQNLALTSSILKYMCRAERPFLFPTNSNDTEIFEPFFVAISFSIFNPCGKGEI